MKRPLVISFFVFLVGASVVVIWLINYMTRDRALLELPSPAARSVKIAQQGHLYIGLVGDSWVEAEGIGLAMEGYLAEADIPAVVMSSGHSGATSKQIYRNLVENHGGPHSAYSLLMDERIKYLVVVAGVNDTSRHMGSDYYAHHMMGIIRAISNRGIKPVVLDVPEHGIKCATFKSWARVAKRFVYRFAVDGGEIDVIKRYRAALACAMEQLPANTVVRVRFDEFIANYDEKIDWYEDPQHLTPEGRAELGRLIARAIVGDLGATQTTLQPVER
jgi:hypothetical protein